MENRDTYVQYMDRDMSNQHRQTSRQGMAVTRRQGDEHGEINRQEHGQTIKWIGKKVRQIKGQGHKHGQMDRKLGTVK